MGTSVDGHQDLSGTEPAEVGLEGLGISEKSGAAISGCGSHHCCDWGLWMVGAHGEAGMEVDAAANDTPLGMWHMRSWRWGPWLGLGGYWLGDVVADEQRVRGFTVQCLETLRERIGLCLRDESGGTGMLVLRETWEM